MPITRAELLDRLALHEDSFVERKLEGGDYKPSLVAFANSVPPQREAVLFIGVRDDNEVIGISNPDALQKKIQQFCQKSCYPPIVFTTELLPLKGKQILAVVVAPSASRPHFAGPAYVRVGTKNLRADPQAFHELITSRDSKAAELLRYRDEPVTVISVKARPGYPEFGATKAGTTLHGQPRRHEGCRIKDVNSFFVRFEHQGTCFSEPLRNIEISYDEEKHCPLILINLDGV